MTVSQKTETHPRVLLMNYLQSREQKWYRASTVFILTPRRTELRYLFENQNYKGFLQKTHWYSCARAEHFGDLITANHSFLRDGCESRHNHRYAVVVQDLATQWIQSYPCKTKTSQETQRSLQKFLEPTRKHRVIYTANSLEFGKACEDLSWNHCTSTSHRSETNGLAERAVRRVKAGTSAVLLQSGLNESWWADSMECYTYLRNVTDLLCLMGRRPMKDVLGNHLKDRLLHLVHWLSIAL